MNHPNNVPGKVVGATGRASWLNRLRQSIIDRTIRPGAGIKVDYSSIGATISLVGSRRGQASTGDIEVFAAEVVADPMTVDDVVRATLDGSTTEIALPYLLRKTPFDSLTRNGVTYTYVTDDNTRRDAVIDDYVERQEIISPYVEGDTIYVVDVGTDVTGVADTPYLDLNVDARAWALLYNYG